MKTPGVKKTFATIMLVGCALGVWIWSSQTGSEERKVEGTSQVGQKSEQTVSKADRAVASAPKTAVSTEVQAGARFQWAPQTKAAIEEFANLSEKVFSNSDEQMRRSELLMNPEYVRNIGDYLLKVPREEVQNQIYDQSLEFLVEALKLGSNEALTQIERVIADQQVENGKLPLEQRKFLGETKGELLYQYAALNSVSSKGGSAGNQTEQQIASLIPGPVTQKIWNQVLQALDANFAESQRELAETH